MTSITITRDALPAPLADLVITNDPAGALFLAEAGLGRPSFSFRKEYAPESPWVAGQALLAAVQDASAIPCNIYARGASTAAVEAAMVELEVALSQFIYTVTVEVDGVARSYEAECTAPVWGDVDSGEVAAHLVRASVVIPVNPEGA